MLSHCSLVHYIFIEFLEAIDREFDKKPEENLASVADNRSKKSLEWPRRFQGWPRRFNGCPRKLQGCTRRYDRCPMRSKDCQSTVEKHKMFNSM